MVAVSCSVTLECYFVCLFLCFVFSLITPFSSIITFFSFLPVFTLPNLIVKFLFTTRDDKFENLSETCVLACEMFITSTQQIKPPKTAKNVTKFNIP